jgi:hypothetical protein
VSVGVTGSATVTAFNSSFQQVSASTATGVVEIGRAGLIVGRLMGDTIDVSYGRTRSAASASFTPFTATSITVQHAGFTEVGTLMCAAWNRVLSEREIDALNDNPWQLLRPRRPIICSLPATGVVLSAATVIDIGQTSARPRVTITI